MARNVQKYILVFFACIFMVSCRPKQIDLDIDIPPSKVVVNSFFTAQKKNVIFVNKSNAILNPDSMAKMNGAEIIIKENGNVKTAYNNVNEFLSIEDFLPEHGHTYTLEVNYNGLKPAISSTTIPYPVNVDINEPVTLRPWVQGQESEDRFALMKVKISDSANTEDYYILQVNCIVLSGTTDSINVEDFNKSDFLLEFLLNNASVDAFADNESYYPPMRENMGSFVQGGYGTKMILSDKLFNGKNQKFELDINLTPFYRWFSYCELQLNVQLYRINKDLYRYFTSYARHLQTKDDPFSEKVQVFNNIENGFGIFGGATLSTDSAIFVKN